MDDVIAAIERHLQRKLTAAQLDYYQVLGLELYCQDAARIRTSLQSALETFKQSEPDRFPESSQLVGKLLKQAQAILLDPSKKPTYDKQLAKLLASSGNRTAPTAMPTVAEPAPNRPTAVPEPSTVSSLDKTSPLLLPTGDPMAPYSWASSDPMSASNSSAAVALESVSDVATRRSELLELFPALAQIEAAPSYTPTAVTPSWQPSPRAASMAGPRRSQGRDAERSENIVEQLKRRRMRRNQLGVGGMILGATVLLAFASYQYFTNLKRIPTKQQANRKPVTAPEDADSNADADDMLASTAPKSKGTRSPNEPIRSNLPSVRRDNADTRDSADDNGPGMTQPRPEANAPNNGSVPANAAPTLPLGSEAMPSEPPDAVASPATASPATPPEPNPAPSMSESKVWIEHMTQARTAIDALDFARFDRSIQQALETATTPAGEAKTARLDQIGQLYKIYTESFPEAKKMARGASSIKAGSSEFIIVEATPEKLTVKAQGKTQTFEWPKLPFGMAVAISDLDLSLTKPTDLAARAVFFSLDPYYREAAKSNELIQKRIQGWFDKSLGKGGVRADLKQGFDDKYE